MLAQEKAPDCYVEVHFALEKVKAVYGHLVTAGVDQCQVAHERCVCVRYFEAEHCARVQAEVACYFGEVHSDSQAKAPEAYWCVVWTCCGYRVPTFVGSWGFETMMYSGH